MTVYIDTETSGLTPQDEVLEIAIINDQSEILLNTLVKPIDHTTWSDAQQIHHISPKMVRQAPTYDQIRDQIESLVRDQAVVIYNKAYDSQYLNKELASAAAVHCCMLAFAEHYGQWDCYHGNYRWQNLKVASDYVLHQWQGEAHRALADTRATKAVWEYLTISEVRQRIDEKKFA